MDAGDYQLGAVKSISFYSCKLTDAQIWYNVMEKEFLGKVKILKDFWKILLGQELKIYTH